VHHQRHLQRGYWAPSELFSKPLYSSVPLSWRLGFHSCVEPHERLADLTLLHLHRMDFDIACYRNDHRKNAALDPGSVAKRQGHQNFIDEKGLRSKWYSLIKSAPLEPIPSEYEGVI